MTTNDLARLTVECVIRVGKLNVTTAQATKAAYNLLVWIENQKDGFTALVAEEQAAVLLRLEMPKAWDLAVASDLVRVGAHWEDNSDVIRELFYLTATDVSGRRFRSDWIDKDEIQERLALIVLDGGINPVASAWAETYPVYGSLAYVSQGTEAELAAQERREEGL